jgi:hypothetical protein
LKFFGLHVIDNEVVTNSDLQKSIQKYTEFGFWFFYCKCDASKMGSTQVSKKINAQLLGQRGFINESGAKTFRNFPENFFERLKNPMRYFDFFECIWD